MSSPGRSGDDVTRVLYVAGDGRSGSTVFANVLGEVPGCVSVGELHQIWQRGLVEDRLCGCDTPFSECEFWAPVCADAGLERGPQAAASARRLRAVKRTRGMPRLLLAKRRGRPAEELIGPLGVQLSRLYAAVRSRSGADIIVDSSKLSSYAALLDMLPDVEVTVVHLVRDSRAVAFSWKRRKERPDRYRSGVLMAQQSIPKSVAVWTAQNAAVEAFWHDKPERYVRVRYEDFIAEPEATVRRVLGTVGITGPEVSRPFDVDAAASDGVLSHVRLGRHHTVSGNPVRHDHGVTPLRVDDEWQRAMPRGSRLVVTGGTVGLLHRYGYEVNPQ